MKWKLDGPDLNTSFSLEHNTKFLSLGSCFAQNIGEKHRLSYFDSVVNPFGVIYNPLSISHLLRRSLSNHEFVESEVVVHNSIHHLMDVHGDLSSLSTETTLANANQALQLTRKALEEVDCLLITWGTTFTYSMDGKTVGNCHKIPSSQFDRKKISTKEVIQDAEEVLEKIRAINKDIKIILTVSPIRHIKDGLVENNRSKASLILACEALSNHTNVHYFPAYEIVVDELRDYRFYKDDMVHPSEAAINHVWEAFQTGVFSEGASQKVRDFTNLVRRKEHRPIHPESAEHQVFGNKTLEMEKELFEKYGIKNQI